MARADKVAFGQFIPADTPVHALDPRAKITQANTPNRFALPRM